MKKETRIIGLLVIGIIAGLSSCRPIEDFADDEIDIQGAELASDAERATDTAVAQLTRMADQATQTAVGQLTEQARQASETEYAHQLTEEPRLLSVGNSRLVTVIEDPKDDCLDGTGHPSTTCTFDIELAVIALLEDENDLDELYSDAKKAGFNSIPADLSVLAFPSVFIHLDFADEVDTYAGYVCIDWLWAWVQEEGPPVETSGDVGTSCYDPEGAIWVMHYSEDGELDQEANPPGLLAVHDARGMTVVQYFKSIYGNGLERQEIWRIFGIASDQSNYDVVDFQYSEISPPD